MYYDYYLNTPDEASMVATLQQAEATDADGNPVAGVLIDVIGTHYERTGGTDEEPVYSQVPGWHVNVRSDHELHWPEGAYTGQPHAPWRSWGGAPPAVEIPAPVPVTTAAVDVERDRRIDGGFEFEGVRYQSRPTDRENIAGAALIALVDPTYSTGWIAADNRVVEMDATTLLRFGRAAADHKQGLIFAARQLKDMQPIPQDYCDDQWWPAT